MSVDPRPPASPEAAQPILGLMNGFRASKALFSAVELGLFDWLDKMPASTGDLAAEHGLATHALERLLGYLASQSLIVRDDDGRWRNLPVAERFLRAESPETLTGYILYSDRILYRLWGNLSDALREGTNRWTQEFGEKDDIFDHFFASTEEKERFLQGMHGLGLLSSPSVAEIIEPGRFRRLADWGGGTAHLAIAACRRDPGLQAVVWDLPSVQPVAERHVREAGLEHRIRVQAGNFFNDHPPEADLISIGRILHDWTESKVRSLLARIYQSLPEGGGLLIMEHVLDADKCGPPGPLLMSLNMLVCTEGRERTAAEYESLVREAGFNTFECRRSGFLDAMLAIK